jgi:hypothetical protein
VSDELGLALLGYGRGCAKYTKNPREKMMEEQFLLGRYHFLVPLCCYCLIAVGPWTIFSKVSVDLRGCVLPPCRRSFLSHMPDNCLRSWDTSSQPLSPLISVNASSTLCFSSAILASVSTSWPSAM